ncbi:MAG TPA: YkvA family protein [Nitrospiraceae bacterium]|jgi:uncharacterized membrane protein YkvA (DUF1232 family)|nr:YkvA family protein [Nitrospiraceae bacterium]
MERALDRIKREITICRLVLQDDRVPRFAKWLLALAIGYAVSPIDLIPDVLPLLGHLDDVIIVPALFGLAVAFIPEDVMQGCRNRIADDADQPTGEVLLRRSRAGAGSGKPDGRKPGSS